VQSVLQGLVPLKINLSPFVLQSLSNVPIICLIQDAEHHRTTAFYTLKKARFLPIFRVMINEFVSLFMPLVYTFLLSACAVAVLLLSIALIVRKRSKKAAVPIPVGWTGRSVMIPMPFTVTAAFRWWAKHPWRVSLGAILLYVIVMSQLKLGLDDLALNFVNGHALRLLSIVLILSFILWMFLNWQQSKIATIVFVVAIYVGYMIIDAQFSSRRRIMYGLEVSGNLRNAAAAQKLYFDKNNSFKSCVACTSRDLPTRFHYSSKVTLNAETGRTGFVLTATHENCGSNVWTYQSTTGKFTGPDSFKVCK